MAGIRWSFDAAIDKQLQHIGGIEEIALVAELAIDFHAAAMFLNQRFGLGLAETDQRATGALSRAAAAEL
jgi:hypothetical protein